MSITDTSVKKHQITDIAVTEYNADSFADVLVDNMTNEVRSVNEKPITDNFPKTSFIRHESGNETEAIKVNLDDEEFFIPNEIQNFSISNKNYFSNSQRWVGNVVNLNPDDTFTAKLFDLSLKGSYEEADFQFDEVSEDDKEFLKVGSVFYWSVGYAVRAGQVSKQSILKFQRLPIDSHHFTVESVDRAADRANELLKNISWD